MTRANKAVAALVLAVAAIAACGGGSGDAAAVAAYCQTVTATEYYAGQVFADVDQSDPAALAYAERATLDFVQATARSRTP